MSVRSAQSITVLFTTRVFATGVGTNADSLPTGTLYLNGTANGATVTVTNISTGLYKVAVTLPTLAVNDEVEIIIAATVSSVADTAVIWGDTKDVFAGAIPDVIAGGSGGLFIAGTNAATTVTGSLTTTFTGNLMGSVASVTAGVTVTTNNDKTGYALTSGERTSVADALLNRDMSAVSDTTARSPLNAFRFLRNKFSIAAGTLTVTKEDDTTSAWTSTLTTDVAAVPITASDPA